MADCTTVVVSACHVGLFQLLWFFMVWVLLGRLIPPQVDSDKLRNELHS